MVVKDMTVAMVREAIPELATMVVRGELTNDKAQIYATLLLVQSVLLLVEAAQS